MHAINTPVLVYICNQIEPQLVQQRPICPEKVHYIEPMRYCYFWIPLGSRNSDRSSLGQSPLSSCDFYFVFGFTPNILWYPFIIFSISFLGVMKSVCVSSLNKLDPILKRNALQSIQPCTYIFDKKIDACSEPIKINARSSAYIATCSHKVSDLRIHMSGSTLHGRTHICRKASAKILCNCSPLLYSVNCIKYD